MTHLGRLLSGLLATAGVYLAAFAPTACLSVESDIETDDVEAQQAAVGTWSTEFISGMEVQLYTPTSQPRLGGKRALMLSLHGCGQTNDDFKQGANWQSTADEYGMVVALPDAPNGGVIIGCWDYYDRNHSRSNRHNDNLIGLVTALMGRSELELDPGQIYMTGLSSGGSETMVMGCLAPDLFAGIGINAGPTIGTSSGQISYVATTKNRAVDLCEQFAGSYRPSLQDQLTSVVFGTSDFTVAQGYGDLNAEVMAEIYGATQDPGSTPVPGGGTEYRWSRDGIPVVQKIRVAGLGHAWPAGPGSSGGGAYIDHSTINYPALVTEFFFCSNRRVPTSNGSCGSDPDPLYCGSDTNLNHHNAGRAIMNGIPPWENYSALGSYQWMGAGGSKVTTLEETAPGYFVVASSCPQG
ncbi:MAG: PHB depolymerase family esterase [Proteobacteria bacterium]|nr:PHB depolymerase family esterase [Pseudomonadota bacterium]